MRFVLFGVFWLGYCAGLTPIAAETTIAPDRHALVVVWDGMRPDQVTEQQTPTLWKLGKEGVVFRNSHSVYFSATNVNGVALATGMYPAHSGVIANHEFRPDLDERKPIDVENPDVVSKGDQLTHGNYITAPTVAELVQKAGGRTVIAASKTVGLLHDRPRSQPFSNASAVLSAGVIWPNESTSSIIKTLGTFPKGHFERDVWTTSALMDVLWKEGVPPFSVLWLGQPDLTQHETAPGAPQAVRAMKQSDDNLRRILETLDRLKMRQETDVFVVSDHGFSTIEREVELPTILADAGFNVVTERKSEHPAGEIMMVGGGGSVLFYVGDHDKAVLRRLVEFLQRSNFAGVIFTKEEMEGTFSLARAKIDIRDAPDAVLAFCWDDRPNQYGVPGMINADWQRGAGKGTHATLSRFDMHNTLIAAGPHFLQGEADDLPAGNTDVAPTVLKLLGLSPAAPMDGRVLAEALADNASPPDKSQTRTIEATHRFSDGIWRQFLKISQVGGTVYLDEGNGRFESPSK